MPGCGNIVWCIKPTVPSWHLVSASSGHITSSIEKFILVTVVLVRLPSLILTLYLKHKYMSIVDDLFSLIQIMVFTVLEVTR